MTQIRLKNVQNKTCFLEYKKTCNPLKNDYLIIGY